MRILATIRTLVIAAVACAMAVRAQTSNGSLAHYDHESWGERQGFSSGRIQAIAQSPDGYLWIGTSEGLFRFDGLRFVPVLTEQQRPLREILGLTVDKDGNLWVRASDTRLRRVQRDSISQPVTVENKLLGVVSVGPGQQEGIYAADTHKTVFHLTNDRVETLPIHSTALLISIAQATNSRLWIGTDRGLTSWLDGSMRAESASHVNRKINCLLPDAGGRMWVGTDDGLAYWDGYQLKPVALLSGTMQHLQVLTLMQDHNANLWVGTSRGLLRYNPPYPEWFSGPDDGETPVTAVMQDREGDIWFGTGPILNRLQLAPIVPVNVNQPASMRKFGPVYVDWRDRVWFADSRQGLHWLQDGIVHPVLLDGIEKDQIYSIDGDGDDIWVGRRLGGLTRLHIDGGVLKHSKTWTMRDGLSQNSVFAVRVAPGGIVWAGTLTGGINRFQAGSITHFDERDGLPANDVSSVEVGTSGEVWIGTSAGVCEMEHLQCRPLNSGTAAAAKSVLSLLNDPARGLWIGTSKGLLLAGESSEHSVSLGSNTSQPPIQGLGLDALGRLWLVTPNSLMSASAAELTSLKNPSVHIMENETGWQSSETVRRSRSIVTDRHGQIWISTAHTLAVIPSKPFPLPTVIPKVEEVSADGVPLNLIDAQIGPGARRLTFSFTGLDLHAPARVRYRYRLDPFDKSWSAVVQDREATYTNLAPGRYTFRLIASNDMNSWSTEESAVQVQVLPKMLQRWSVRCALAISLLFSVALAFHARMRFLLAQANILAEERLRERSRIARDIHDTLLQGFISSLMHLHVAERQVPEQSPLKQKFAAVLEGMERVIEEARLAVIGLRASDMQPDGIECNLKDFFLEIADLGDAHLGLRTLGTPRELSPEVFENISAIAKEALVNSVRHAGAQNVHVTVRWGWLRLRLYVSDDGCGIDPKIIRDGRPNHWGLTGMRERAIQMGGQLMIKSKLSRGTTISLAVPAWKAYRSLRQRNH